MTLIWLIANELLVLVKVVIQIVLIWLINLAWWLITFVFIKCDIKDLSMVINFWLPNFISINLSFLSICTDTIPRMSQIRVQLDSTTDLNYTLAYPISFKIEPKQFYWLICGVSKCNATYFCM
jgi:hypothetical protein